MNTVQSPAEVQADRIANELAEVKAVGRLMRDAQRAYFRDRTTEALQHSKQLERRFDNLIKPAAPPDPQGKFF